jgi:uncharacterized membrane protein YccC
MPKRSKSVSWFSALKHSWRAALRIDRSQITAVPALRSVIGFVLPLALGVATGHVVEGVSIAGGAISLGSVGLTYAYRARMRTMLLACAAVALSAFVGSITSRIDWLAILVVGIWGIGAGLLVAVSQSAMVIGLQAVVALIILSHFALDPVQAVLQAALMFIGALLQAVLLIVPSPWQRTTPERTALATVYQKLADYAVNLANEESSRQTRTALLKAHSTLSESNLRSPQGRMFFGLLGEADRIRLNLLILIRLRRNLIEEKVASTSGVEYLDQVIQFSADALRKVANELEPTSPFVRLTKPHQDLKKSLTALRRQAPRPHEETMQQMLAYCDTLRDQLHLVKKLAKSSKYQQQRSPVHIDVPPQGHLRVHNAWAILRANLTPRSATLRHAIRLGFTLALATALYRLLPLPIQRGYWIPLTALLVLKPDFVATFTRGAARLLGTMLGAVLTTLLVSLLAPTNALLVILDAIMAYLAFSVLFVNYAIFSMFLTMETVFLLTFVTPQPLMTAADRAIDTAVGGVLALLIYALWPTWELSQVPSNIAKRLEAIRRYVVAILEAYAHPGTYDALTIHNLRMEVRLARSNAEASVARSLQEPEPHRVDLDLAQGLLRAADAIAQSILTLEANLLDNPSRHALPELIPLIRNVDESLRLLVTAVREGQPIKALPNLQEELHSLKPTGKLDTSTPDETRADLRLVKAEVKRIIRSIHVMNQLLATKLEKYEQREGPDTIYQESRELT